jgi:hypothetical protein
MVSSPDPLCPIGTAISSPGFQPGAGFGQLGSSPPTGISGDSATQRIKPACVALRGT